MFSPKKITPAARRPPLADAGEQRRRRLQTGVAVDDPLARQLDVGQARSRPRGGGGRRGGEDGGEHAERRRGRARVLRALRRVVVSRRAGVRDGLQAGGW
ncbi:MAG: hypothetical protein M3141_07110, partial [Actinomycetota bacterium]|nr:hypothetical protein [Actinomycetota bacterium]